MAETPAGLTLDEYLARAAAAVNPANNPAVADGYTLQGLAEGGYVDRAAAQVGYGPSHAPANPTDPAAAVAYGSGVAGYGDDATATRTPNDAIRDTINSGVTSFLTTPTQMVNMAIQAASPNAGAAVTDTINRIINVADGFKSDGLHAQNRAYEARNTITAQANLGKQQEEIQNGSSPLVAGLRRLGRDYLDSWRNGSTTNTLENVANMVGSLATVGPIEKAGAFVGTRALRGLGDLGVDIGAVGDVGPTVPKAVSIGRKIAAPAWVGAQMSAGVDHGVATQILNMSPEDLASNFPEYQRAVDNGVDPATARNRIARNAALTAAALNFPVAAVAGKLIEPLVDAPFMPKSAIEGSDNILKSGLDGAIQGADGPLSANLANSLNGNVNQDNLAGVGEGAEQGLEMGLGMGGALQSPAMAVRTADEAVKAGISGVKAAGSALAARGQRKIDALNNQTSAEIQNRIQNTLTDTSTPEAKANFADLQAQSSPEMGNYVQNILARAQISPDELNHPVQAVRDALQSDGGATDRFDAFRRVAGVAGDKSRSDIDRVAAAQYLLSEMEKNHNLLESPSRDISSIEDENHPALPKLRDLEAAYADAREDPNVMKAIDAAKAHRIVADQVNPSTPEGKAAIYAAMKIAEHNPENVDPAASRKILSYHEKDPEQVPLAPEQKQALQNSIQVNEARAKRVESAKQSGIKNVSADIHLEKTPSEDLGDDKNGKTVQPRSAIDHVKHVMSAIASGDTELARQRLRRFGKFAEHMQNKVTALNEHFEVHEGDKSVKRGYKQLGERTGKFHDAAEGYHLSIDPREVGGVKFARALNGDAKTVHEHYNMLARAYPDLGKEKEYTPVHSELTKGSLEEAVKKFQDRREAGKPQFDPSWDRLTKYEAGGQKAEAEGEPVPPKDAKADTAPASQANENKGEVRESSTPKASTEEKVPTDRERFDALNKRSKEEYFTDKERKDWKSLREQFRNEHKAKRDAELKTVKPGELKSVEMMPEDLQTSEVEKGMQKFAYRSKDGKTTITGSYNIDGNTLENLDIGNTHDVAKLGMEARAMQRKIAAEHPGVEWVHGFRISGARVNKLVAAGEKGQREVWYKVTDRGNWLELGPDDPRGVDETVQTAEATPASEEVAPGSDQEAPASTEAPHGLDELTIGNDQQGDAAKSSVAKQFPHLFSNIAKKVVNWFAHGFKLPENSRSRLVGLTNPIDVVREAIGSPKEAAKFTGEELKREITPEVSEGFHDLLYYDAGEIIEEMNRRLQEELNKPLSKDGPTVKEAMISGNEEHGAVNLFRRLKVLNFVQENEKGEFEYNNNLQEGAVLAGIHWLLTQDQKGRQYDQEGLAEMLGIDPAEAVDYLKFFNGGHYTSDAIDALRQHIENFWGVKARGDIPDGLNKGLSEAMAKEIVIGMKKAGLIEDGKALRVEETGKTYTQLRLKVPEKQREKVSGFPDLLGRMISKDHVPLNHIGSPPEKTNIWQMGYEGVVKATGKQKRTLEANEKRPYFLNVPRVDAMINMGRDGFIKFMGYELHDEMNINDRKSKEGFNTVIGSAYDYLTGLKTQIESHAKGQDIGQVPVHFEWRVSRMGRFHMQGRQNPQSNKFVRAMLTTTHTDLDLNDPHHKTMAQLAVAQSLGVKIENFGIEGSIDQLVNKELPKYPQSMEMMKAWAAKDPSKPFLPTEQQQAILSKEFGEKLTPEVMHALPEYARFLAHPEGEPFHTDLPLEVDGKTDGPGHFIFHMMAGGFTPELIERMGKVGAYFGGKAQTYTDHFKSGIGSSANDLYKTSANLLAYVQRQRLNDPTEPVAVREQRVHLLKTLSGAMNGDLNFDADTGHLEIERGVTKNPMTTYIYGAGLDGIAAKIAGETVKKFYEDISNGKVTEAQLASMDTLVHGIAMDGTDGEPPYIWDRRSKMKANSVRATKDFTFTDEQLKNLSTNVKNLFVQDMKTSIEHTLSNIGGKDPLRDAVAAQGIILGAAVRNAWAERIKNAKDQAANNYGEDYGEWNKSIGLSEDERNAIRDHEIAKWHPIIEGTNGNIFPAGAGNAELGDGQEAVEYSRGLKNELSTTHRPDAPGNPGVRGLPFAVQNQDGAVIQNSHDLDRSLPIHDGINVPLDKAVDHNAKINEAVYKVWTGGQPLMDASRSFKMFLEAVEEHGLPELSLKDHADLKRIFGQDLFGLEDHLSRLGDKLERAAISNRAMKNVLEKVNMSIDHMPGTETAHTVSNKLEISGTHEHVSDQLNQLYHQELDKLTPKDAGRPKEFIAKELQSLGKFNSDYGIRTFTPEDLKNADLKLRPSIMQLYNHALDAFSGRIHIGDKNDLLRYAADHPNAVDLEWLKKAESNNTSGWYDPNTNDVFIANHALKGEVLVHELVHAATRVKAWQFIHDQSQLQPHEIEAFGRIERLRQQWMKNPEIHGEDLKAYNHLMKVMAKNSDDPSDGLNEFMAYATTKDKLIQTGKETRVKGKLATLLARVAKEIRRVFFGNRDVDLPAKDLFSNLKFNTHIIMEQQARDNVHPVSGTMMNVAFHQSEEFGQNPRLGQLRTTFARIMSNIPARAETKAEQKILKDQNKDAMAVATQLSTKIRDAFPMSPQERSTFNSMVATFFTTAKLDPNAMLRVQTLYDHAIKNLTVEDLMKNPEMDDQADRDQAHKKLEAISGQLELMKDSKDRSSLLPVFLALSNVKEDFGDTLSKLGLPKTEKSNSHSPIDYHLDNVMSDVMDRLEKSTSGEHLRDKNVRDALFSLTQKLGEQAIDDQNFIANFSNKGGSAVNKLNDYFVENMEKGSTKAIETLNDLKSKTNNKYAHYALETGKALAALLSKDKTHELQEGLTALINDLNPYRDFAEIVHEVVGRTLSGAGVHDLIKVANATVGQVRQKFREELPTILSKKFKSKLTDDQVAKGHRALIRSDFASLRERFGEDDHMDLIKDPRKVQPAIDKVEAEIRELQPDVADALLRKTAQLGRWMNTDKFEHNFLPNAEAIAHLFDEREQRMANPNEEIIQKIDHLASLYALRGLDADTKKTMADLAKTNPDAVKYTADYLVGQRKDELSKAQSTEYGRFNHFKGYTGTENLEGASLRVAPIADEAALKILGYTRGKDYGGSAAETAPSMAYYRSEGSGKSPFLEGIAQYVQGTGYGVDVRTGFSHGPMTAGRITDRDEVKKIYRARMLNRDAANPLRPIRDGEGHVIAWERTIDPDQEASIKKPVNMFKVIGQWRGRQAEEIAAHKVNQQLVEALHDMYHGSGKGIVANPKNYVNLFDPKEQRDPVIADAMKLITPELRKMIEDKFGPNKFIVRRELINNVVGYRQASVGDFWTGDTRWNKETQDHFVKAFTGIFGVNAYKYLRWTEKTLQDSVQDWKTTIVVRSVVVLVGNMRSDWFQLMSRGMNPVSIAKGYAKKLSEIYKYDQSRVELNQIEADMRAATNRPDLIQQLQTRRQAILDSQKRLSIWPLIESGQYSMISNMGKSENDDWKYMKSLDALMERWIHKLPEPMKTTALYYTVSRDTSLFKGLERAVEYSDFLGRAVLYEHLTENKKMNKTEAMAKITQDFINYDYLPGRSRSYLESMGMTWFWNYKLRALKAAISIMQDNPLHMLLSGLAPHSTVFGNVGTPMRDNFLTAAADGRLWHSIGPQVGFESAGSLNPFNNMLGIWVPEI